MKTNHKFTLILLGMLTALLIATLFNVALNFRSHALSGAKDKAIMAASIVKDGLTAHMVNGTMDQRQFFLNSISMAQNVKKLWVVRASAVDEQFGKGMLSEYARDKLDQEVLDSGQIKELVKENSEGVHLRVTIPYTASVEGTPNCLSCHTVPAGTVLGAVSMEFDISNTRNTGTVTLLKILGYNIIFIIIAIWITNHFLKPFIQHFEDLREGVRRAYTGDFDYNFDTKLKGEGAEVIEQLNHLFRKMQETFGEIKLNLTTFLTQSKLACDDPLREAQLIIKELSDVYKFKKTIELDKSKEQIFERIAYVINKKFDVDEFALFEIDKANDNRHLLYATTAEAECMHHLEHVSECRAFRTDSDVISTDFPNLCHACAAAHNDYLCIPFTINENITLVLSIFAKTASEIEQHHEKLNSIKNYFETAKPVLESRILMDQLRDSSLRDGMTGLYNRRFLEEFIDKVMRQTLREDGKYSVLMIDIDFFKLVNDTYGHDAGDIVIKGLSTILKESIRVSDLAIRYGGEEFLVLLHNATPEGATNVANKIREHFDATKFDVGDDVIQKTLSIGIAHFPSDADSIWKVIKYADSALYVAKNGGRDQVVNFKAEMFSYEEEAKQ